MTWFCCRIDVIPNHAHPFFVASYGLLNHEYLEFANYGLPAVSGTCTVLLFSGLLALDTDGKIKTRENLKCVRKGEGGICESNARCTTFCRR